jgi:hypothetical protein
MDALGPPSEYEPVLKLAFTQEEMANMKTMKYHPKKMSR